MVSRITLTDKLSKKVLTAFLMSSFIILFFPVFVFSLVAFSPSFITAVLDQEKELYLSKSVLIGNFCGILPLIPNIIKENIALEQMFTLIQDSWLMVLGSTGIGWVTYLFIPKITAFLLRSKAYRRLQKLEGIKKELYSIWGEKSLNSSLENIR